MLICFCEKKEKNETFNARTERKKIIIHVGSTNMWSKTIKKQILTLHQPRLQQRKFWEDFSPTLPSWNFGSTYAHYQWPLVLSIIHACTEHTPLHNFTRVLKGEQIPCTNRNRVTPMKLQTRMYANPCSQKELTKLTHLTQQPKPHTHEITQT